MKIEQKDKRIIFNETIIPDIFLSEYLNTIPGDYLKIYLYLIFLIKYTDEFNVNDLVNNLNLSINTISEGMNYLEDIGLILRKPEGYDICDIQEKALNESYTLKIKTNPEKIMENERNKERIQLVNYINEEYFKGVMSSTWYTDIDTFADKYGFDDHVIITLFDTCSKKNALHRNYVQKVAEIWNQNHVKNIDSLEDFYIKQDKILRMKNDIAKKLGRRNGLTQYEEAYIENWINDFGYDMDIIEIALKRSTYRNGVSFEYLNNLISSWYERNLKTPEEVIQFIEQRTKQNKNEKELRQKVKKESFEQRQYDNNELDSLLKKYDDVEGETNG